MRYNIFRGKEGVKYLIYMVVATTVILTPIYIYEHSQTEEKEKILNGEPTYEGIVVSVTHSSGGWGASDITSVELENLTFPLSGLHSFKTDTYYKFWVRETKLLKVEEIL